MSPLNQRDILAAAKATGRVIPVQIYLYSHYDHNSYGYSLNSSQQLESLVKSLDPMLVQVVGEWMGGCVCVGVHPHTHPHVCVCGWVGVSGVPPCSLLLLGCVFDNAS
jgi:hypothetical protein